MKRLTSIILAFLMIICLAACGAASSDTASVNIETTEETTPEDKEITQKGTVAENDKNKPDGTSEGYENTGKPDAAGFLTLSTSIDSDSDFGVYEYAIQKLHLNSREMYDDSKISQEDCPALSAALEEYNKNVEQEATKWAEKCEQDKDAMDPEKAPYTYEVRQYVQRADDQFLSFLSCSYGYEEGYHVEEVRGYNYDTQTGNTINLSDVIIDIDVLSDILADTAVPVGAPELFPDYKERVDAIIEDNTLQWTLGYDGITCYFNMFELAPGNTHITPVKISFREAPNIFAEKYTNAVESYAFQVPLLDDTPLNDSVSSKSYVTSYDVDGDGTEEGIGLYYYGDPKYSLQVSVDDNSVSVECVAMDMLITFIHLAEGKNYIYVEAKVGDLYTILYAFEAQKDIKRLECEDDARVIGDSSLKLWKKDLQSGWFKEYDLVITDPDKFEMENLTDNLANSLGTGNIAISRIYHVGDDGLPSSDDTEFKVQRTYKLVSKISLSLKDMNGKTVTFPADTEFDALYTDDETYVKLGNGSEIYLLPLKDDAGNMINYNGDTFEEYDP